MRAGRLSSRLARIRENGSAAAVGGNASPGQKEERRSASEASSLTGWTLVGSNLYERNERSAIPCFKKKFSAFLPLLFPREKESLHPFLLSSDMYSRLVFFDLETTGLSHGTGTVAFMAALARISSDGELETTQLLIDDYPGEPGFLERFSSLAGRDPILVSFNGKGFDSQILTTRYLMNGIKPSFLGGLHLDLLYPSRRLWKRELANCRLSTIETEIFASPRVDDLPGSEAPDAWFDYLRSGTVGRLLAVGEHNLDDVKTLARLLYELDRRIEEGTGRAALIRALDLRASKDYAAAERFLSPLADGGDPIAARILAIDAEHRLGKPNLALALARGIGDERRVARLESKIANQGALDL